MDIYLPIADTNVNIFLILGLGLVVGFLSGLLGIGGGIILNPTLIKLGIPPIVTVGTSVAQMVGATVSGFISHLKLKNVDIKMGVILILGGFIGGGLGVGLTKFLENIGYFRVFILSLYSFYLAFTGITLFRDILSKSQKKKKSNLDRLINSLPFKTEFQFREDSLSILVPVGIGFISGFLAAVMGVGGGFVVIPALMYLAKYPVEKAVGLSLFQMIFITAYLSFFHSVINHGVDIVLALLLMVGSSFGAVFGASFGQKINKNITKLIMAFLVSAVSVLSFYQLIFEGGKKAKPPIELVHNPISDFSVNNPYLYAIGVILVCLILGFIISSITHRLKILLEIYFERRK